MKLMEWADLKVLYKRSRKQPNKLLFKRENARRLWPMWAAAASTIPLVVFAGLGIKNPALIPYAYIVLFPWALALYLTRLKALQMVYPRQFAEHAIDRQSSLGKENILCYAFFLEALRDEGYTAAKLRELSAYADLTGKPARPALSQNLGFASLVAFMVALCTEVIKATPFFTLGKGWVFVMMGIVLLVISGLILDGIHSTAYERDWVKRYLDMAAYDLEEPVQLIPQDSSEVPTRDAPSAVVTPSPA
ncbi:hypothetical protein PS914_05145 [Pseudomonas fluorescens]|uniref:hypothetical protein n=1 Tax=Pseudomonas fluorescens TaxID=294 RepID=UPI001258C098|nr:hypothetical protein [Pseudomonas fluorescens]VVQ10773.1 hypothetical protein PS914_05145 [Pseudomonas fluorescens]